MTTKNHNYDDGFTPVTSGSVPTPAPTSGRNQRTTLSPNRRGATQSDFQPVTAAVASAPTTVFTAASTRTISSTRPTVRTTSPNSHVKMGLSTDPISTFVRYYRSSINNDSQRARCIPFGALLKMLESYAMKELGQSPPEIRAILSNIEDAVFAGRVIEGDDIDTRIASIIEKINSNTVDVNFVNSVIKRIAEYIVAAKNPELLNGYIRDDQDKTKFTKKTRGKVTVYSADEIANNLITNLKTTRPRTIFEKTFAFKPSMYDACVHALKSIPVNANTKERPGYMALCEYLAEKCDNVVTATFADAIVTCILRPYTESTRRESNGKMVPETWYNVPKNVGFMKNAESHKWTVKSGPDTGRDLKFTVNGPNFTIKLSERQQIIAMLFNKVEGSIGTIDEVAVSAFISLPNTDKDE